MSEHEVWKPCAKHHKYMCSNLGNIANIKTGFLLKPQINRKGYYTVTLSDVYKHPIKYNLHRIIAETFIPNDTLKINSILERFLLGTLIIDFIKVIIGIIKKELNSNL